MLNYKLITKNNPVCNDYELKILNTLDEVKQFVKDNYIIAIDTENSGLDPHTGYEYCIQIGNEKIQYIIDMLSFSYKEIKELLEVEGKLFLGQNLKYDLQWFYKHNIIPKSKLWDTYLAELRLTNGIKNARKNLQALEEKYLQTSFVDKSQRKDIHTIPKYGYTERVMKYSAGDVYVLPLLYKKQLEASKEADMLRVIEMECEYVKSLAYMEYCGIYLDRQKWLDIAIPNKQKLLRLEQQCNQWIIDNNLSKYIDTQLNLFDNEGPTVMINWNSSKQLIKLFEELGVNCTIVEKGKTKKSIESKLLKKQIEVTTLLPIYLKYASKAKEVSTYGEEFLKFINEKTGRVHPSYFQVLASGRQSSGGDEQTKNAKTANVMVIPREGGYRSCFTAQDPVNDILINWDYSAMENVVFANKCKDPIHISQIIKGIDQHSYVAKLAFAEELKDIPQEEVKTKAKKYRQDAKAVGFAILFGKLV